MSTRFSRRSLLGGLGLGAFVPGAALAQQTPREAVTGPPPRLVPVDELVNVPEFEEMAKLKLDQARSSALAGGSRDAFDRMTFRPRVLVSSAPLDLSISLFGQKMFAPLIVGPVAEQRQFHPDAELATVRGAEAAKTTVVVSSRSSVPLAEIAAATKTALWYQEYAEGNAAGSRERVQAAQRAGCKAICVTVGADGPGTPSRPAARIDWRAIDLLRQGVDVPFLIKGIMTADEAKMALDHGIQGVVVSRGTALTGRAPIQALPAIAEAVAGRVPVLIDGGFRRGSDILKALALGAQAVVLARPPMWGLSAYGAPGVQGVLELLQTELARLMITVGRPTIQAIDRNLVRIHA